MKSAPIFVFYFVCLAFARFEYGCESIPAILEHYGYSYENHTVTTTDGYILGMFRLTGPTQEPKPVIVMQHGISASANSFLENGKSSFALYLVDRGYEVWLPSGRGTRYSKRHKEHSYDSREYWNFTFEDLGVGDTKAYLEYVCRIVKRKVYYLGFSQGFMQMLAAFSLDPEFFKSRVRKIVGWGAVTRLDLASHVGMGLVGLVKVWPLVKHLPLTHVGSFDMSSCLATSNTCSAHRALCRAKTLLGDDFLPYHSNPYTGFAADVSCMKTMEHLGYNTYEKGFFRHPSHGERVEYDLNKVEGVPIGVCVGEQDLLATPANARWLEAKFKSNGNFKIIGIYNYLGHRTFATSYTKFQHYTDTYIFLQQ